jgi:O-antigen ligase
VLIAFFIPLSVAVPSLLTAIYLIIWLVLGNFKDDWNSIKENKVVIAVLFFTLIHIIGLLWSSSLEYGLTYTIKKESRLLLIPLFMLFVQKRHIKYYFYAFLLAISIAEISSYAIFFHIIEPFNYASSTDPTPFLGHIIYNPLLSIAIYILMHSILFDKEISQKQKFLYSLFVFTMSVNMFITGGRAGQIMYFAMLFIISFQYFEKQRVKAVLLPLIIIPIIATLFYNLSPFFQQRVNSAYSNIANFQENRNTSVGIRVNWAINSIEIIKQNPLIGHGTGSFRGEYKKMNQKNTPEIPATINPHNMYIFELVELGLLGFTALLFIFYSQIKSAFNSKDKLLKHLGVVLPLLFMLMILSESYLLLPSTAFFFAFFSAILYKDYKEL